MGVLWLESFNTIAADNKMDHVRIALFGSSIKGNSLSAFLADQNYGNGLTGKLVLFLHGTTSDPKGSIIGGICVGFWGLDKGIV